jgi:hypothetical protein
MTAVPLLFLVPLLAVSSGLVMYRFSGRRQMLKFDLVQFIYGFVISPILFVCLKTFLFILIKNELGLRLSVNQLFILDTGFSVIALYVYGFVVIHSLTTSFKLVLVKDPLTDLFEYSEYFHLWLSHIVMLVGSLLLLSTVSVANIFLPFLFQPSKPLFFTSLGLAVIAGLIIFITILNSDPKQKHYLRIMKLLFGFFFIIHAVTYFIFDPAWNMPFVLYWSTFTIFTTLVSCSLFAHRSHRATRFFNSFKHKKGWGKNIKLFKDKN